MPGSDTRNLLLRLIVEHGGATVAQACDALHLADATVRRHLDKLALDGLVIPSIVRAGPGRPSHLYTATEAGVRRERDHSHELAARLLGLLQQSGQDLDAVAEGMAEQVAASHRGAVPEVGALEVRVQQTVAELRQEGILDHWERTAQGYRLHNNACPYRSAAEISDCVCESDRRAIEKLVGTQVQQVSRLAYGDGSCEYLIQSADIRPAPSAAPRP